MAKFPDTFSFTNFNTPSRVEADVLDLQVGGNIPEGLDGAFYRVQPDPQFPPPLGDDIAFNGDAMISRFRFKNGKVDFKQRWAHTDKWKLEREAGKALFGAYRNPLTDDPSVKGKIRGTANTNAFIHGGKLYGLKEDSPALVMDPVTMETEGYTDFNGKMTGETFTAHPKIDPATGNMAAFGYASKGVLTRDMTYYEITPEGKLLYEIWFETPYYCMMHDFAITEDYALFSVVPIVGSWERLEKGLPHFGFDTTMPTYLGVVPRKAGTTAEDVRWFKGKNCFTAHVMNGYQEGSKIHIDMPISKNNMFPFFPDVHGAPFNEKEAAGLMTRWSVDLDSDVEEFEVTQLCDIFCEFPRIDDRYASRKYRYGWVCVIDPSKPVEIKGGSAGNFVMNSLGMINVQTGENQKWWAGPSSSVQEPCFIPRSKDAPEGDGWVVMICNRLETHSSDLLIFEAQEIDKGPIATIKIPVRMRFGLHGNWVNAEDVALLD